MSRKNAKNILSSILPILPNEIILEILSRLPAKYLVRLRCILDDELSNCIDTPSFQRKHAFNLLLNQPPNELLVVANSGLEINKIIRYRSSSSRQSPRITKTYNLTRLFKDIRPTKPGSTVNSNVIGASNGLICLNVHIYSIKRIPPERLCIHRRFFRLPRCGICSHDRIEMTRLETFNQHLILWNPCTKAYHILPNSQSFHFNMFTFDNVHQTICGFGYDVANKTYKVVVCKASVTQLYDISTNSWKTIDTIDITWSNRVEFDQFGEYINSSLHWIVSKTEIFVIDLSTEVTSRLNLPNCCATRKNRFHLGVLKGCLSLLCYKSVDKVNVWVMKEYGRVESWTNMLITKFYRNENDILSPSCVSKDAEMFLFLINDIMAYWFSKYGKDDESDDELIDDISRGIVHVDTLVSPNPKVYSRTKSTTTTQQSSSPEII